MGMKPSRKFRAERETMEIVLQDQNTPASSSKMGLVNLRDLVETAAHRWYKDNEKDSTKAKWGKTYNWKELVKEIDWRSLKVRHDPVIYTDLEMPGAPKNHILFRSTFLNDTNREQEYNLKAVRRTVSTCSFSIFEGYTTEQSASLELEVPLPKCVIEASTGFRREYTLEQSRDKQVEEELTWSVESNIRIPNMSQTTAELVVQEDEYHGTFEIKSYFFGDIRVKLYKDSQEILSMEFGDLEDLFPRDKGFRKDARGIYRITRGECKARFGVSQKVELHAKPLADPEPIPRPIPQQQQQQQQQQQYFQYDSRKNSLKDTPAPSVPSAPVTILRELIAKTN